MFVRSEESVAITKEFWMFPWPKALCLAEFGTSVD